MVWATRACLCWKYDLDSSAFLLILLLATKPFAKLKMYKEKLQKRFVQFIYRETDDPEGVPFCHGPAGNAPAAQEISWRVRFGLRWTFAQHPGLDW